jgi:hypothetical protein
VFTPVHLQRSATLLMIVRRYLNLLAARGEITWPRPRPRIEDDPFASALVKVSATDLSATERIRHAKQAFNARLALDEDLYTRMPEPFDVDRFGDGQDEGEADAPPEEVLRHIRRLLAENDRVQPITKSGKARHASLRRAIAQIAADMRAQKSQREGP